MPPGLLEDTLPRRKKMRRIRLETGKISIPPKNRTANPVATELVVATIPASNHTIPDTTAPVPPRRYALRSSDWATAMSKIISRCQVAVNGVEQERGDDLQVGNAWPGSREFVTAISKKSPRRLNDLSHSGLDVTKQQCACLQSLFLPGRDYL